MLITSINRKNSTLITEPGNPRLKFIKKIFITKIKRESRMHLKQRLVENLEQNLKQNVENIKNKIQKGI